jgi:hypothetical protein
MMTSLTGALALCFAAIPRVVETEAAADKAESRAEHGQS